MSLKAACRAALATLVVACAPEPQAATAPLEPARYIFAWAYDIDERAEDTNFLAVIDADPLSATYATVVATMPTRMIGGMPHHTEQIAPPNGWPLFANSFHAGRTFLLDLNDPLAPRIAGEAAVVPGYHMPHSFYRLSDGRVLATLQFGDDSVAGRPGGVALFAADGSLLRTASSRDDAFAGAPIRTYSADISEATDRAITVSSPMGTERTADVIQLWRLSDLTLLRTLPLPVMTADTSYHYPFEVRFLPGGGEAVLNTWYCGFYHLDGVDGDSPTIERVASPDHPRYNGCGVPLLIGHWWIMPIESTHEIVVYDVSDPRRPRHVHALSTDSTFVPHWSSRDPGSDRLVFPTESPDDARILLARFDSITGALAWDDSFRDPASDRLGVSLRRDEWPHGATGPAAPHGVVFGGGRPR
jgi:hypothetical protein